MAENLLRQAQKSDLDKLYALASSAKENIASLPPDKPSLEKLLNRSELAFKGKPDELGLLIHLFVLLSEDGREIIGTSALHTETAACKSTSYYLERDRSSSHLLHLVKADQHYTELASLYVRRDRRSQGLAPLLSLGRYLYIKQHPSFFCDTLLARLRGATFTGNPGSFWQEFGSYLDQSPFFPIPTNQFSPAVQQVIGDVHPKTKPALHMLHKQGFHCHNRYELSDVGPRLEANKNELAAITQSQSASVVGIEDFSLERALPVLLCTKSNFFCCIKTFLILSKKRSKSVIILPSTAEALKLSSGDTIYFLITA